MALDEHGTQLAQNNRYSTISRTFFPLTFRRMKPNGGSLVGGFFEEQGLHHAGIDGEVWITAQR